MNITSFTQEWTRGYLFYLASGKLLGFFIHEENKMTTLKEKLDRSEVIKKIEGMGPGKPLEFEGMKYSELAVIQGKFDSKSGYSLLAYEDFFNFLRSNPWDKKYTLIVNKK